MRHKLITILAIFKVPDASNYSEIATWYTSHLNHFSSYDVGQTLVFYDRTYNANYFRLIASYNFRKLKKSNYNIRATGQDENSRAN